MRAYYNDIDPYCCRVLRKQIAAGNLPPGDVDERDIRDVKAEDLKDYGHVHLFAGIGGFPLGFMRAGVPDDWRIISGGFPCQDISTANHNGKGLAGSRSGLWSEYIRIVRKIRPKIVCVENVSALTFRGLDRVLWDFTRSGFDAEWQTIPAQAFGAPHGRDRVFIVAYRSSKRRKENAVFSQRPLETASEKRESRMRHWPGRLESRCTLPNRIRWCPDSELCRVVNGIPDRLDRYRALGNSIVPQCAEWIGLRILAALKYTK